MADNLTDVAEDRTLDWTLGGSPTGPVGPMKVALVTAAGSDSTPGTEVNGGSYTRQTVTFTAASGGSASNDSDLLWTGMPECTVVGVEIWDSAGSPVRWWYGPLAASKSLGAGDEFKIPAGQLTVTLG